MTGEERADRTEDLDLDLDLDAASEVAGEPATDDAESSLLEDEAALAAAMGLDDALTSFSPLERAERERDDYLDALRRLQAEFDNYRKRVVRQQTDLLERASESLIERLLPVLDALDLAIAHGASDGGTSNEGAEAVPQIAALLRDTLNREGLERIDELEVEFDPTIHDAVAHAPADDDAKHQHHVVDEVLRPGYRLKGRVIRPAMVRVRG